MSLRVVPDALDAELTRARRGAEPPRGRPRRAGAPPRQPAARIRGPDRHDGREWAAVRTSSHACGPTSRRIAPSWPPPVPCARGGRGPASASGRSCTSCPESHRDPWRHPRSRWASWPPGWRAGSARSPTSWRQAETVHLAALAGLGPLVERVRDARAAGASCSSPTSRTPRCSRHWPRPSTSGSRPASTIPCRSRPAAARPRRRPRRRPGRDRGSGSRSWRRSATDGPTDGEPSPTRSRRSTRCGRRRPRPVTRRWRASPSSLPPRIGSPARAAPPARRAADEPPARRRPRRPTRARRRRRPPRRTRCAAPSSGRRG